MQGTRHDTVVAGVAGKYTDALLVRSGIRMEMELASQDAVIAWESAVTHFWPMSHSP